MAGFKNGLHCGLFAWLLLRPHTIALAQDLAITKIPIYSAPDAPAQKNVTVLIRHVVIAEVGAHVGMPTGIKAISCESCVVLAGFWNAHVHFMEPEWNDAANQPAEQLTRRRARTEASIPAGWM